MEEYHLVTRKRDIIVLQFFIANSFYIKTEE